MGRGDAQRRRKKAQERALLLKGVKLPASGPEKKKTKENAASDGLTRAHRKMLALKQVAAAASGGGKAAPQQAQARQPQRSGRDQAAAEQRPASGSQHPARGHEAPAAEGPQQQQQQQQSVAAGKAPQQSAADGVFQAKRLKSRKKEFLKVKKLRKTGKLADPSTQLTDKEAQLAAATEASRPRFGEQAYQPLKVQLKRKHWAGEGTEQAATARRCGEIFERQMAAARTAAAAAEAARDDSVLPAQRQQPRAQASSKASGKKKGKQQRSSAAADEAVRLQLIEAYRLQKQQRLEAAGKAPLLSATAQSLADLVKRDAAGKPPLERR